MSIIGVMAHLRHLMNRIVIRQELAVPPHLASTLVRSISIIYCSKGILSIVVVVVLVAALCAEEVADDTREDDDSDKSACDDTHNRSC